MKKVKIALVMIMLMSAFGATKAMLLRGLRSSNRPTFRNPAVVKRAALNRIDNSSHEQGRSLGEAAKLSLWERAKLLLGISTPASTLKDSPAVTFSRGSSPFGEIGRGGPAKQTMYYSQLIPTQGPEEASSVALAEVPTGPAIAVSFEPSLKSKIPYTTEHEIEKLFESMNQKLRPDRGFDQITLQDIQKFKNLVTKSGYNPINRHIQGQPSFLAKLLEYILINESDKSGNVFDKGRQMLQECYEIGARLRDGEIEEVLKKTGWDEFLKKVIQAIDSVKKEHALKYISNIASQIVSLYDFFTIIGFDLTKTYWANTAVDMDAMKDIVASCNRLLVRDYREGRSVHVNLLDEPLFYFSPECIITKDIHLPVRVAFKRSAYRDYPIGAGSVPIYENTISSEILNNARQSDKFVSTFIAQAKKAGFFKSDDAILHLTQDDFNKIYTTLMYHGKYVKNEPLFRSFMLEYAPDKLQAKVQSGRITQELADDITKQVTELIAARNAQLATE